MTLLDAIARMEGWEVLTSRNRRNNNPGNIEWGKFSQAHGACELESGHTPNRFAVFPTSDLGFACLEALLKSPGYISLNIEQCFLKYAPGSENDTMNYIASVCKWMNCERYDMVKDHLPA